MRRFIACCGILMLLAAACGDDDETAAPTDTSDAAKSVTVEVDNDSPDFNFEAIAYYPTKLTVAPGTDVRFHSNFKGEPHTVTVGSSIDKLLEIFDALPEDQQEGPPPPEAQALKVPFIFADDADFSDLANLKLQQSAAQPCFLPAGATAPGADPCPKVGSAPAFDGTQPIYNSGLLKDDENFTVPLADNIAPGTYEFICLFHGPEMRGQIEVVAEGGQDAAAVTAAGKSALDEHVAKVKPEVDKAEAEAKPGTVKAGVSAEDLPVGVFDFFPEEVSVPVGGAVTWDLSFHTVSFNAPEDARPAVTQDADGTWRFNAKTFQPVGFTPPEPPEAEEGGEGEGGDEPPPPLNVDGGSWNGTGFYNSGSFDTEGDVLFKMTFAKAGTYKYECLIHPDMEGTVKVG